MTRQELVRTWKLSLPYLKEMLIVGFIGGIIPLIIYVLVALLYIYAHSTTRREVKSHVLEAT